jgi:hypothetical protein
MMKLIHWRLIVLATSVVTELIMWDPSLGALTIFLCAVAAVFFTAHTVLKIFFKRKYPEETVGELRAAGQFTLGFAAIILLFFVIK